MRILHLVHRAWPYHGGAERYVMEHALAGERWGHSSVVCTTDAWDMSWFTGKVGGHIERREDTHEGVRIIRFPVRHPPFQDILRGLLRRTVRCGEDRFFYPNPFVPSMGRWLAGESGFDTVHTNAMPFILHAGWEHAVKRGCRLVSVPHANVGEKYRRTDALRYFDGCQARILRESCFTVAQSRFERDLYLDLGVPPERIHLSGSGIDPSEFTGADGNRARNGMGLEGPIVLSLTAHCSDRGTRHILEAFRAAVEGGLQATLVLAGPVLPDARRILEEMVPGDEVLERRVVVTGYVRQDRRIDLIKAADLVVLPSRLDCFGIVLLEAWMLERPVIGCWSGAMPDLVEEGSDGFLVPFGDPVTLAHRIRILMENRELASSMGERGRRKVEACWTWDRITDDFYRRLSCCYAGEAES
ncbi:MAG: hypothetical protein AVO35_03800 [Candidatus Aegiribacteria sp. MLS_C]|nr:MAG: hypothetical protein AVO35_03800 [Candidatus Aegiribacteria sp. MLS_C]